LEEVQRSILPCAAEGLSLTKGVAFSMKSRRKFLTTTLAMGLPAGILALMRGAQARGQRPQNPQTPKEDDPNPPRIDPKLVLEENQKEIKKSVEKLYDLASELKAEVEKTDSVHVLSVAMLRKTDEIEKLAKEIRSRAKG